MASDDLGRKEILRFDNKRVFVQLYNSATYAIPALGFMDLAVNQQNLKEQSGYFLRTVTIGIRSSIVKQAVECKLYPFFIL